ncbi:MAG: adenylate kinase [Tannerellaceae bacterium]|jgi:adenylate kinase|nr:adenylate kinase [Tannerellaceae bacterium]
MLNVVISGAPGSGKGTQSEWIIREFGLRHISTGELLRTEIRNRTEMGEIAGRYIDKGQLLPDELIIGLLSGALESGEFSGKGIIFDGYPRTIPQAVALKNLLNRQGSDVSVMINLEVEEEELVRRMMARGDRLGRSDDRSETIRARLEVYHQQTAPLVEYYTREGKLHSVRGTGSIASIFAQIKSILTPLIPSPCQTL